jgi:hypothetical protein
MRTGIGLNIELVASCEREPFVNLYFQGPLGFRISVFNDDHEHSVDLNPQGYYQGQVFLHGVGDLRSFAEYTPDAIVEAALHEVFVLHPDGRAIFDDWFRECIDEGDALSGPWGVTVSNARLRELFDDITKGWAREDFETRYNL